MKPTKLYTRRKFIGLGLMGAVGWTGGIRVIDNLLEGQDKGKHKQKLIKPSIRSNRKGSYPRNRRNLDTTSLNFSSFMCRNYY